MDSRRCTNQSSTDIKIILRKRAYLKEQNESSQQAKIMGNTNISWALIMRDDLFMVTASKNRGYTGSCSVSCY